MKTIPIMKTIKIALLTIIVVSAFTSCNMKPPGKRAPEAVVVEEKVQPIKVLNLTYTETAVEQNITASIIAFEETYLSPALQGRIRSVKVEVNDHVKKGQLLVEMDRTQLDQTQLQYQQLQFYHHVKQFVD